MKILDIFIWPLLFTTPARADILFLDVNNNSQEIKAAREAAQKRGENLVVLGRAAVKDPSASGKIKDLVTELDKIYSQDAINETERNRVQEIDAEISRLDALAGAPLSMDTVNEEMAKLKKKGVKVSSIVISGHDGNGNFSGSNGNLTARELKKAIEANAPLGEDIRSIFLAGCYTGNQGAIQFDWKPVAPNLNVIGGYDGSAPAGDKPAGHAYMKDFLVKEKALSEAKDLKQLNKIFNNLKGTSQVHAAICVDNKFVNHEGGAILADISMCKAIQETGEVDKLNERIDCYKSAAAGCEKLPPSSNGELRQIYNRLQDIKHCSDYFYRYGFFFPSTDNLIRLILHPQVMQNMESIHRGELSDINENLAKLGLPENLRYKNLSSLNRKQLVDLTDNISNEVSRACNSLEVLKRNPSCLELYYSTANIHQYVVDPQPSAVPFSWVEPGSKDKSPRAAELFPQNSKSPKMDFSQAANLINVYESRMSDLSSSYGSIKKENVDKSLIRNFLRQEESWARKNLTFENKETENYFFKKFKDLRQYN